METFTIGKNQKRFGLAEGTRIKGDLCKDKELAPSNRGKRVIKNAYLVSNGKHVGGMFSVDEVDDE